MVARDERDDAALLQAHCAGDPEAFGVILERHRDRLWAIALRTMGDPDDAADGLQDALVSALRHAGSFRGDAAVSTWLHRIVVNACLDRLRRRQARPSTPLGEHDPPTRRDEHAAVETRLDVRAALAALPEAQRLALVLVDMEGVPVAEAAELLRVPVGTVKSRCARGRLALASALGPGIASPTRPTTSPSTASTGNRRRAGHVEPSTRPRPSAPSEPVDAERGGETT